MALAPPALRSLIMLLLLALPSAASAEGLLVGAPNPNWVKLPFGLSGAATLWLLAGALALVAAGRLPWKRAQGERRELALAALTLPAGLTVLLIEFLLWGLLDTKLGMTLTGVLGLLLGVATAGLGLPLLVRSTIAGLSGPDLAGRRTSLWLFVEATNLICVTALITLTPEEGSALAVLVYVTGQALALRLAAVERDNFAEAGGAELSGEIGSRVCRHNVVLVALVYLTGAGLTGFPEAAVEVLLWALVLRVFQPIAIWATSASRRFLLPDSLEAAEEQDLMQWINATASMVMVFATAFLLFRTLAADGFFIDEDFWWAIAAVAATGLITRMLLDGGRRWALDRLAGSQRDKDEAHATVHQIRGVEAVIVLLALVIASGLFEMNALKILVSLGPMFLSWVLAFGLLAFGYCLGDGLTAPSDEEPPQQAPRYELESLALATLGLFLIGNELETGVTTFGLLKPVVVIGALLGVALHGFLFPLSVGIPKGDLTNSARDRLIYRVRQVHCFLALFFLHAGLGLGLPLLSVTGFVSALFVMTAMDLLIAPGKALEERFNTHAWLLFGLLGTAIASQIGAAIEENGVEIFSLLPIVGPWIGDVFGVTWLRPAMGVAVVVGALVTGTLLRRRGMKYRLPEQSNETE